MFNPKQKPFYSKNNLIKLGHRGFPKNSIENTLESFKESLNSNLDGVELDVQFTSDKKIIVYHDWNIKTECGKLELIKKMSYDEINNIASKSNYRIPLLIDVLELLKDKCIINIEIKSLSFKNTKIERYILDLIALYNIEDKCIISSFNPFIVRRTKKINNKISTAFLWTKKLPQLIFNTPIWIWYCLPDGIHIDIDLLNENSIQWIRKNNLSIMVFTITNKKQLEKAKSFNVDGVIIEQQKLTII